MTKPSIALSRKALIFSSFFLIVPFSHAFDSAQDYGIEVKGQASILVEPDSFALSIAIIEKGRFTDKIRAIVDNKSNQVVDIAKGLGIKSNFINSARVSLRVIEEDPKINVQGLSVDKNLANNHQSELYIKNNTTEQINNVRPQYFELSRNITVNFSDIKDYDQFLNQVIKIGVNQISPLTMSVGDTDKYYQQALAQAVTDAKTKAQQIAKQSEQTLGKLVFVKEISSNHYRAQYNAPMMSMSSSYRHNSQVGNQAISASVLVKYSIE